MPAEAFRVGAAAVAGVAAGVQLRALCMQASGSLLSCRASEHVPTSTTQLRLRDREDLCMVHCGTEAGGAAASGAFPHHQMCCKNQDEAIRENSTVSWKSVGSSMGTEGRACTPPTLYRMPSCRLSIRS